MKKFVVGHVNFHDNQVMQKIVHADSELEAAVQIMYSECIVESTEVFKDLDHLQELMFDRDVVVGVIEI